MIMYIIDICSFEHKFCQKEVWITEGNIDVLMISGTKIDNIFFHSQFLI